MHNLFVYTLHTALACPGTVSTWNQAYLYLLTDIERVRHGCLAVCTCNLRQFCTIVYSMTAYRLWVCTVLYACVFTVCVAPHVEVCLPSGCLAAWCAGTELLLVPSSTLHHTHLTWLPVALPPPVWLFKKHFPKLCLALCVLSEIHRASESSSNCAVI